MVAKPKKVKEEPEIFHVEVITKARVALPDSSDEDEPETAPVAKKGKRKRKNTHKLRWEYFVKWGGYSSDNNTWEPEENVAGCQRLLASFWEHVGMDNNDYYIGYEVAADETWIKKEKRHFALEYAEEKKRKQEKHGSDHRKKTKKRKKSAESSMRSTSAKSRNKDDGGDDGLDAKPLEQEESGKGIETSDEDIPLSKLPPRKKRKTDSSIAPVTKPETNDDDNAHANKESANSLFSSPEPEPRPPVEPAPLPPVPSRQSTAVKATPVTPFQQGSHGGRISGLEMAPSGSGISTKQRLALGALAPVNPKAKALPVPKPRIQHPPPRTPSTNMIPTSFKKKTTTTSVLPVAAPLMDDIRSSTLPHSPEDTTLNQTPISPGNLTRVHQIPPTPAMPLIDPHMAAAEAFLSEMMPPDLAGPLKPATESSFEPQPPRPLTQKQLELPIVSREAWTWSGPVFTEAEPGKPAFEAQLLDATTPINGGLNLRVALAPMDRLYFSSFHDAVDLKTLLPACQGVHQFARFGPKEDKDAKPLELISRYMAKMQKIIFLPIHLDNLVVGHIIFSHPSTTLAAFCLKPPPGILSAGALVAALVPWTLTTQQLSKHHRNPPNHYLPAQVEKECVGKVENQLMRLIKFKPHYQHALRLLKFPHQLLLYLSDEEHKRTFCVWFEGGDGTKKKAGLDTVALFKVLERCNTKHTHARDARIIFIHVGVINSLHRMPFLLDICSSFHVQFYTYGSHETVAPEFWGVREVYPCGGIVTFTPQAIIDDPVGVLNRIRQIHSHPMWECYILPSVLGMVASLCPDPIADLGRGKFPFKSILDSIEEAEISLISSPADSIHDANSRQKWLKTYWTHRPHGQRATLQVCIEAFSTISAGPRGAQPSRILDEISEDLRRMRSQPALMAKHRRFVVIDGPNAPRNTRQDALEWTTTTHFDFKDDFFPLQ